MDVGVGCIDCLILGIVCSLVASGEIWSLKKNLQRQLPKLNALAVAGDVGC